MATYKFGNSNYILPFVEQVSVGSSGRVGSASTPARAGAYAGKRYQDVRQVKIGGTLIGDTFADLQDKWSTLCAAHAVMVPAPLFAGRDDWFLWAVAENINDTERGIEHIAWEIEYTCHDPYWYSLSEQAYSITNPANFSVSTNGNANALPRFTITISAAPAGGSVTLTNLTTAESFTLTPTTTGQLIVDSRLETCTDAAGNDRMSVFSGRFVSLKGDPQTVFRTSFMQLTTSGGAAVSGVAIAFRDRSI